MEKSTSFSLGKAYLGFFVPILDDKGNLIFQKSSKKNKQFLNIKIIQIIQMEIMIIYINLKENILVQD